MKLKIDKMRPITNGGKVKAFFTVRLGPFDIEDMKLIDGQNGMFISFPSKKVEYKGETKYFDIVRLARGTNNKYTPTAQEFYDSVLEAAIAEYEARGGTANASADAEDDEDLPF